MEAVRAGSEARNLLATTKPTTNLPGSAGTSSTCVITGISYQPQCALYYTNIGSGIRATPAAANNVASGVFPESPATTGFYSLAPTAQNRVSQTLYGADLGIGPLVKQIFKNYPVGTPGATIAVPVDNSFVFKATASCPPGPPGQYLMGGTAKISCIATATLTTIDLQKVASNVASLVEYTVETGVTGSVSVTYVATDPDPVGVQSECSVNTPNDQGCSCTVSATPLCYNPV